MALEYVGGASGVGTSTGYTVSLTGLTGGIASAPAAGDLVVVASAFGNTASSAPAISGNNSGAYLGAGAAVHANDTWDTEFRAFYQVMGATPDTSLTVTRATNTAYGGATVVHVWRGADPASPIHVTGTPASGTNGAAANPPSITPTEAGSVVVAMAAGTFPPAGTAGYTGITGYANTVARYGDGSTADVGVVMASLAWTSGAADPPIATGGTQNNTSSSWAAQTIAIRPLAALAGALDKGLDAASSVASGAVSIAASAALALATLTGGGSASLSISGSSSASLAPASLVATGAISDPAAEGSLSSTLGAASLSSSGSVLMRGQGASTLSAASVASSGSLPVRGSVSTSLAAATISSASGLRIAGATSATLESASASGEATNPPLGIGGATSSTLEAAALASSARVGLRAQAAGSLSAASLSATGAIPIRSSLFATLASASSVASASVSISGSLSRTLDAAGGSGAASILLAAYGERPLASATVVASGSSPIVGSGAALLDPAEVVAVGAKHEPLSAAAIDALVSAIWSRPLPQGAPPATTVGLHTLTSEELEAVAHAVWSRALP